VTRHRALLALAVITLSPALSVIAPSIGYTSAQ